MNADTHVEPEDLVMVCLVCQLDGDAFTDESEATYLVGVHNDLHHGSRPEAFVVPLSASQSTTEAGRRGTHV